MTKVSVEVSDILDAPADKMYEMLSENNEGDLQVLPGEHFGQYVLEEHDVEHDLVPGTDDLVTRYVFTPVDGGKTRASISSEWTPPGGLMGLVHRHRFSVYMRWAYKKGLGKMAEDIAARR